MTVGYNPPAMMTGNKPPLDPNRTVTLRKYGLMRGITAESVRYAIKNGRLKDCVYYDHRGWPRIDPVVAQFELEPGTPTEQVQKSSSAPVSKPKSDAPTEDDKLVEQILKSENVTVPFFNPDADIPDPIDDPGDSPAVALARNKAIREAYEARLKKLEWETKTAALVEADQVQKTAFKLARALRDSMMSIPDRIASELVGETDQFVIHRKLTEELRNSLGALTDGE